MVLISNRGNLNGSNELIENTIFSLKAALKEGFSVCIDVTLVENEWMCLGTEPNLDELLDDSLLLHERVYINCTNEETYEYLCEMKGVKCFYWSDNSESEFCISNFESNNPDLFLNNETNKMFSKNRILTFLGTYEEFKEDYNLDMDFDLSKAKIFGILTNHPESFKKELT